MRDDRWDDEIWDEHRWEEFLRESDRRTDLYIRFWDEYCRDNPPPPEDAPEAVHEAWECALHAYLARKMGWDEATDDVAAWLPEIDLDAEAEEDEPEAWKVGLVEQYPEAQDVRDLPVFQTASAFSDAVLAWTERIPENAKDAVLVEFCSSVLQVAAKIASGHRMGYEPEMLGGNIAVVKRGLRAANRALVALRQLREAPYLSRADYLRLYEQAQEVRNAVGLHVQILRERFERGE